MECCLTACLPEALRAQGQGGQRAHIVLVMGARTRAQLDEMLGAVDIRLEPEDLALIERAIPEEAVAGTRYDEAQLAMLDSERD